MGRYAKIRPLALALGAVAARASSAVRPLKFFQSSAAVASSALQEIVALFGYPVGGNPAQYLMEKAFAQAGLDWRYLSFEVAPEQLADAMRGARAMGFRGGNLAPPHITAVPPLLDDLTEAARLMGAANVWKRQGERLLGDNTDGKGLLQSLRSHIEPAGKRFVLLGAGAAARAVAVELGLAGAAEILIVNRTAESAEMLAGLLAESLKVSAKTAPWQKSIVLPEGTDVLINATSIGHGDPQGRPPIAASSLAPGLIVADAVYHPAETRLLRDAKVQGCVTLDGLTMLVNQAALAFRYWTSLEPDLRLMREAAEEYLSV